jgi:hypothetical protein
MEAAVYGILAARIRVLRRQYADIASVGSATKADKMWQSKESACTV